ncbi:winged helix-turn-helix domain-containing protein [Capnocytophaga granulosa]|uniref:winged helix-turn-helix domain-containing protein n=1 Tax=Capnocytophaga granulosa TaxID=45242 RepID=UPI0023F179E7|nr:winged helix-turn-helix domain-containing protein [Capnocytophaga granulosa]
MKVLGYVNRFSRGVYRVQKELEENGNGKASFDFSLITAFRVVEPISTTYFEEGFGEEESDNKLGESTDKTPNKLPNKLEGLPNKTLNKSEETPNKSEELPNKTSNKKEELPNKSGETPNKFEELPDKSERLPNKSGGTTQETTQERILVAIQAKPEVTQKELAQTIGITLDGIKYHIKNMTKLGIIKHEGSTKSGKWIIINN